MASKFKEILRLDTEEIKRAEGLRQKSVQDAAALEKGPSSTEQKHHILWTGEGYEVGVGKPGKESRRKTPNPYDMWPFMRKAGTFTEKSATFGDIFLELEHMKKKNEFSLELLGCLLVRSALMLDHKIKDGMVTYTPPLEVVEEIEKDIPQMFKVPLLVFLQYLDAIALQEDVKYRMNLNKKGEPYGKMAGRPNNLLTCARLIAHLLGKVGLVEFAYGFAKQRGVSALQSNEFAKSFPLIVGETTEEKVLKEIISPKEKKKIKTS